MFCGERAGIYDVASAEVVPEEIVLSILHVSCICRTSKCWQACQLFCPDQFLMRELFRFIPTHQRMTFLDNFSEWKGDTRCLKEISLVKQWR